jgi:hypothetical protein
MAGGYVKIKAHSRRGGTVSMSKQFHTKAYTRQNGKKVKQSKSQYNRAHSRKGTDCQSTFQIHAYFEIHQIDTLRTLYIL